MRWKILTAARNYFPRSSKPPLIPGLEASVEPFYQGSVFSLSCALFYAKAMTHNSEIIDVLCRALGSAVSPTTVIAPSTAMDDLRLDSLTVVSAIAHVEMEYNVQLSGDDVIALLVAPTVEELAAALKFAIAQRGAKRSG
jgi:acyl carrier protein